jgi:very-short-patch-repair endonuclease
MDVFSRQERNKSRRPGGFVDETAAQRKYFARIVSLDEVCDVTAAQPIPDRVASWVASQQLHLITTAQARAAGLTNRALATRCKNGLLHRVHHGVYLHGQPTFLPGGGELAAVLACGEHAVVASGSACALFGVIPDRGGPVDITVIGSRRVRAGIRIHRASKLHPADSGTLRGIPIVSPARALLEFAAEATGDELERAIAEAYAQRLTTERAIKETIARNPLRTGVAALKAELQREGGPAWTQREAERRLKLVLRKAHLPTPQTQYWVAGYPADFAWPKQRLIVEVDSFQFHGHRQAFERDRKRDQAHVLAGYRVIRITWRQLDEEPFTVVATIAAALSASRAAH